MASKVVKEVGAEVAQVVVYNYLKPEQEQILNGKICAKKCTCCNCVNN